MSKKASLMEEVKKIGLQVHEKLEQLQIPPYPKHYRDTFLDILQSNDDPEIANISKKYPHLFFENDEDSSLSKISLSLAVQTAEHFKESNEQIKNIAQNNKIDLDKIKNKQSNIKTQEILNLCDNLQTNLIKQLKTAEETIVEINQRIEQLEQETNINQLTKMYNKNMLDKYLEDMLRFGLDKSLEVFVAVIDADDFKSINTQFGHIAGDKTLVYLSSILQNSLRQGTSIYHTSGNEFTIILNRLNKEDAFSIIDRIIKEISSSKLFYKGNNINLTISVGITKHKQSDSVQSILKRAYMALEEAKKSGKNCYKEEN